MKLLFPLNNQMRRVRNQISKCYIVIPFLKMKQFTRKMSSSVSQHKWSGVFYSTFYMRMGNMCVLERDGKGLEKISRRGGHISGAVEELYAKYDSHQHRNLIYDFLMFNFLIYIYIEREIEKRCMETIVG